MITRRNLLRSAPAAAVAVPMAAREMVRDGGNSIAGNGYINAAEYYDGPSTLKQSGAIGPDDWVPHEVKNILSRKQEIANRTTRIREGNGGRHVEAARLDSLRSLSPCVRLRSLSEWDTKREAEIELNHLDARLKKLCEDHPIAATLAKTLGVM